MKTFSNKYFRQTKYVQQLVGMWPYGNRVRNIFLRFISGSSIILMAIPQVRQLKNSFGVDNDLTFYSLSISLYVCLTFMKLFTSVVAENKIRSLCDVIESNWKIMINEDEKAILMKYSQTGVIIIRNYMLILISGACIFLFFPLLPTVFDKISPLEEPRATIYLVGGDVGFDKDKYYLIVYCYDAVNVFLTAAIIAATDSMYMSCVQHCVGLFAITGYRLENTPALINKENSESIDPSYEWLVDTIKWHNNVLRCVDTLENTFSGSFLVLIGISLIYFSILCNLTMFNISNVINLIRYGLVALGCIFQVFFISWPGQMLADESLALFTRAYLNEWYNISKKSKMLLRIIFLRSLKPFQLSAGGVYGMNFQNFAIVMKTSLSYVTILGSFR